MYVYEMLGAELLSNLYDKLGRLLTDVEQPASWQVGDKHTDSQNKLLSPPPPTPAFDSIVRSPSAAHGGIAVRLPVNSRDARRQLL